MDYDAVEAVVLKAAKQSDYAGTPLTATVYKTLHDASSQPYFFEASLTWLAMPCRPVPGVTEDGGGGSPEMVTMVASSSAGVWRGQRSGRDDRSIRSDMRTSGALSAKIRNKSATEGR